MTNYRFVKAVSNNYHLNPLQMKTKELACVILPTYNEAQNVALLIPKIFEQADKIPTHELHVLIVDDNSPDGTGDVVRRFKAEYPALHIITGEKKGLGEAYKRGMAFALSTLKPDIFFEWTPICSTIRHFCRCSSTCTTMVLA